jgi:hypothetical protein
MRTYAAMKRTHHYNEENLSWLGRSADVKTCMSGAETLIEARDGETVVGR